MATMLRSQLAKSGPGEKSSSWPKTALLLVSALLLNGCHSIGFSDYVTPTISGRVLSADTGKPLSGVKVLRLNPGQSANAGSPAKGAELLQLPRPEITGADGVFVLAGSEYFTFFNRSDRWSARVAFQAAGFATLQTNYTSANIMTNSPTPVPTVCAGDVFLKSLKP
jgi:hypothetical protein